MCGRYSSTKAPARLAAEFDAADMTGDPPRPDHNVAPTKPVMVVIARHPRGDDGEPEERVVRTLRVMRWGLVPKWAKDRGIGAKMINARAETVRSKPAFRSAIKHYRCLVPADGWYEWKRDGADKRPFYLTPADGSSIAMAGIWSTWRDPEDPEGEPLITCSVLTTDAVGPLAGIHDRMPLLCATDDWARWLDPDHMNIDDLLTNPVDGALVSGLELRPVSTAVNSVRNNGPSLVERVEPGRDQHGQGALDLGGLNLSRATTDS